MSRYLFFCAVVIGVVSCGPSRLDPGPDRQGEGLIFGAASGAGVGAITGAQVASATGPGVAVGAGVGAVVGSLRGLFQDQFEEDLIRLTEETRAERERAFAHEVLADHYERRQELHPTRDIFPADIFFRADESQLRPSARAILRELMGLHQSRYSWSRLVVTTYVKSNDPKSEFARDLAEKRAEAIGNELTRLGIEPRRIEVRGVVVTAPVLIDPLDHVLRYSSAVEFSPSDVAA